MALHILLFHKLDVQLPLPLYYRLLVQLTILFVHLQVPLVPEHIHWLSVLEDYCIHDWQIGKLGGTAQKDV